MSTHVDLAAIVTDFYAKSAMGDFTALKQMMTDDFIITEADNLPFGGVYRTKDALENLFNKVMPMMRIAHMDTGQLMVGESQVACIVRLIPDDDANNPIELTELFIFDGDKVREIRPYYFNATQVAERCKRIAARG